MGGVESSGLMRCKVEGKEKGVGRVAQGRSLKGDQVVAFEDGAGLSLGLDLGLDLSLSVLLTQSIIRDTLFLSRFLALCIVSIVNTLGSRQDSLTSSFLRKYIASHAQSWVRFRARQLGTLPLIPTTRFRNILKSGSRLADSKNSISIL